MKKTLPFGTWPSKLSAEALASASPRFGEPKIIHNGVIWTQSIPEEKGRMGLFACFDKGSGNEKKAEPRCILPAPFDARSKAHEYGGGSFDAKGDTVYFVNAADQQIYATTIRQSGSDLATPKRITNSANCRFADLKIVTKRNSLLAVCEDHSSEEPIASIVEIDLTTGEIQTLVKGADFYAGLCVSPCETKAACIQWHHPNMPWDVTELIELDLVARTHRAVIDKSAQASNLQPGYSPDGALYCVSDKSNWWNLIRADDQTPVFNVELECATPQWVFGMQNWGFVGSKEVVLSATKGGGWQLYRVNIDDENCQLNLLAFGEINDRFNSFSNLHCTEGKLACLAAGPTESPRTVAIDLNRQTTIDLYSPPTVLEDEDISVPSCQWLEANTGEQVHLWYYPPANKLYQGPSDGAPPLIVLGHGGPTGATDTALSLKIQYWTQRGFAVADVNYRGSTGFGKRYRDSLKGQWGVFDVEDLCAAAEALVAKGLAHPEQKIIKGSSAGGYSVLAALTQHQTFNAGVSLYGVADLVALAKHTHKFEAHYLDTLIGPYPEAIEVYQARSPINNMAGLNCPIFVAQGTDDKVVPPEQAEMIVNAAKSRGLPVHYCLFEGEGHGFRQSDTLKQLFAKEHEFYLETFALGGEPR